MKHFFIFIFILVFCGMPLFSLSAKEVVAPTVYFKTTHLSFAPGSEFVVGVFLNSEPPVNAVRAEVGYSAGLLEWIGSNTSHSIIRIWKDTPRRSEEGKLLLEGGLSVPFAGHAGELIELYFRVRENANQPVQISLRDASVYLADGNGTEIRLGRSFLSVPISVALTPQKLPRISDAVSPAITFFKISKEPVVGRSLVIWDAADGDSGIASEEISMRSWLFWSDWETRKSPVSVPDNVWGVRIAVTDRSGNRAESVLYRFDVLWVKAGWIALFFVIILVSLLFFIRRRFRVS